MSGYPPPYSGAPGAGAPMQMGYYPPAQGNAAYYPPPGGQPPQGYYPDPSQGGYGQPGYGGGYAMPAPPSGYAVLPQQQMGYGGYATSAPVVQQQPAAPAVVGYLPNNCPPGLEYLTQIDQLIVKQKVEILEAALGCETKNKYVIKNSMGQPIYKAKEDTDCCTRNFCGPTRPFELLIKDNFENEVIHLSRPLRCQSALCPCFLQILEVSSPPGNIIGTVEQEWSLCSPEFVVKDLNGEVALRITGPLCTYSICGDVDFQVMSPDGSTQVGKISKQWSGLLREAFTDADNFGISFPVDLDVKMKATLIGALFLIDFMFFEKKKNEEDDGLGML